MLVIYINLYYDVFNGFYVEADGGNTDFKDLIQLMLTANFVYEQEEFVGTSLENMKVI